MVWISFKETSSCTAADSDFNDDVVDHGRETPANHDAS
jgi:hypothetical protein